LNLSGTKKCSNIYLDSVYKGDAYIGISRPDLDAAYPGYTNGSTSGFSYALDLSILYHSLI